jgi:hypothetical protein
MLPQNLRNIFSGNRSKIYFGAGSAVWNVKKGDTKKLYRKGTSPQNGLICPKEQTTAGNRELRNNLAGLE